MIGKAGHQWRSRLKTWASMSRLQRPSTPYPAPPVALGRAAIVAALSGLFLYGAATNPAYGWATFGKYVFDERVSEAAWNTLQLTIWSMVLGLLLGVVIAVMRLSPNPVFKAVSWVYLWIFRGTPVYVQLVFWGCSDDLPADPARCTVRPVVLSSRSARSVDQLPPRHHRVGPQRGGVHGRDHPSRDQLRFPKGNPRRRQRWACRGG